MNLREIIKLNHQPSKSEPWMGFSLTDMNAFVGLLEFVHALTNIQHLDQSRNPILFRGQSDNSWDMRPKIYRIAERLPLEFRLGYEFDSVTFFKQHAHRFLNSNSIPNENTMPKGAYYFAEWLSIMQHYGAPTRLLDWTSSFNVALYFATSTLPKTDGVIWYFNCQALQEATPEFDIELTDDEEDETFKNRDAFISFGKSIKSPSIIAFNNQIKFDRMAAQHSTFTVSDHITIDHRSLIGKFLWNKHSESNPVNLLTCIEIPSNLKSKIREHLSKIGISAGTLFPGVEGLGKTVQEIFEIHESVYFPTD